MLQMKIKQIKLCIFVIFVFLLFFVSGCCTARYNYYLYKSRGEDALKAKDFKKAQYYFSVIYKNESKEKYLQTDRTCWAFYRLGVIAELTNDVKRARGYYWGDSVDEGFYTNERLINWYAKAGWKQMDEFNKPRTLEEILEFEKTEPSDNEEEPVEVKKEIIVQKKRFVAPPRPRDTTGQITATYNRSTTPPPPDAPEPFKVYY